ncbi:arylsulfatase [Erwinia sp. OLTSP20]|uniref:sulfatase-like hydrolase/transferase n=1 Tax=unclassified Erwinia TaxID=2622719 RepID=UPI000C17F2DE|nr:MULTISPECIES: sulfatase-like hydrolase/transferase [unclassified Erwinia]PIJ50231.1 arylsulfatase [Erwinia sp. OAMSP11]PIJ72068.1 arylsulfatase [Erwinia sp. OLSSP12]PIJ81359.1 arylsulfatase [Erwinia sp. OLCASP19]PIJ84065.1 arylsulfatase [Erwinia sp. OLMTSP26]PIJ85764.1 arylsulfatase [Erwinia sp. OLMDSP33]
MADSQQSAPLAPPNVLFITVDQWPGYLFGFAGHDVIETPTIDNLARCGVHFPNAYAECPVCIPARRTIMTGTTPKTHGDRVFQPALPMPALPTLAQTFVNAGYQTSATGKLHVYPTRDRIGFQEAFTAEEGRSQLGGVDDYEIFLAEQGQAGKQFMHGMSNNDYSWRNWHLDERLHVTNWITETAAKNIRRRDPTRPAFWYVSYTQPHPPITPLASYFERYRQRKMDMPRQSAWSQAGVVPYAVKKNQNLWPSLTPEQYADMRRAFYAQCTHIDHQIRLLIGALREEGILDDTIMVFTSDHGDMLGDHGMYAKRYFYQSSAQIPMVVVDRAHSRCITPGSVDKRLVGLQDIMPTLLSLCDIPVPASCDGLSMVGETRRQTLYCESLEGAAATRMITDGRYKLIWYPAGNHFQLFDLQDDPDESDNLSQHPELAAVVDRLRQALMSQLYGSDLAWIKDNQLIGCAEPELTTPVNRGLSGQRGPHFPPLTTAGDPGQVVGFG